MAQVRDSQITYEEALDLVHRLVSNGTPDPIIRETLITRGLSASTAESIIREVRDEQNTKRESHINPYAMQVGLLIITLIMLFIIFMLLVAPVR